MLYTLRNMWIEVYENAKFPEEGIAPIAKQSDADCSLIWCDKKWANWQIGHSTSHPNDDIRIANGSYCSRLRVPNSPNLETKWLAWPVHNSCPNKVPSLPSESPYFYLFAYREVLFPISPLWGPNLMSHLDFSKSAMGHSNEFASACTDMGLRRIPSETFLPIVIDLVPRPMWYT